MNYAVDILGVIIVAICAIIAYKKGFIKTFFGFVSAFVALILAFALCNTGADFLKENTDISEWIETSLMKTISKNDISENKDENDLEEESTPVSNNESFNEIMKLLPEGIKNATDFEEYKQNTKKVLVENISEIIIKIISWVLIYLIVRIILFVLCIIFDGIMSIPFLKQVNELTGLVLGIILGIFRIYVILAIVSFLVSIFKLEVLDIIIKDSLIISYMYENNVLLNIIL